MFKFSSKESIIIIVLVCILIVLCVVLSARLIRNKKAREEAERKKPAGNIVSEPEPVRMEASTPAQQSDARSKYDDLMPELLEMDVKKEIEDYRRTKKQERIENRKKEFEMKVAAETPKESIRNLCYQICHVLCLPITGSLPNTE